MAIGNFGAPGAQERPLIRQQLLEMGLADDQILFVDPPTSTRWTSTDVQAATRPEFASLLQRLRGVLRGMPCQSICITGHRIDPWARQHVALQVALGLAPTHRNVVLVDYDFLRPGLGGLVPDPMSPGVSDYVRSRQRLETLLLHPVAGGPNLLPAGSSPDDLATLPPTTVLHIIQQLSQMCDLALYVTPLLDRGEKRSLASWCDHIVYAAALDPADQGDGCAESVRLLLAQDIHVAGVVLYMSSVSRPETAPVDASSTLRPRAPERFFAPSAPAAVDDPDRTIPPAEPEPVRTFDSGATQRLDVPPAWVAPEPAPAFDWAGTLPPAMPMPLPSPETTSAARARRDPTPAYEPEPRRDDGKTHLSPQRQREAERQRQLAADNRRKVKMRRSVRPAVLIGGSAIVLVALLAFAVPRLWNEFGVRFQSKQQATAPRSQELTANDRVSGEVAESPAASEPAPAPAQDTPPPAEVAATSPSEAGAPSQTSEAAADPATSDAAPGAGTTDPVPAVPADPPAAQPAIAPPPPSDADLPAPKAGADAYAVHVASYQSERQAAIEIATLRKRGYVARAVPVDLGAKGVWLRVYVGPYSTAGDAQSVRAALLAFPDYADAAVRRVPRE